MAKKIKQMIMSVLKDTFKDVRDMVLISSSGVDSQSDNQLRLALRKKNIRLQVVKNTLARKVFDELGLKATKWEGSTVIAWGGSSLADLSKEIDGWLKKNVKFKDKFKPKGALSDGLEIDFATALRMPTRIEALGRISGLATAPARRLAGQLISPAGRISGQVKTISEKPEAPAAAAEPAPAAPPA